MTQLKARPNYVLVFAIRGKRKVGRFYTPTRGSVADYHDVQKILLAEFGEECSILSEGVTPGDFGYIIDSYELESIDFPLWGTYRKLLPLKAVAAFEHEAKETDGMILAHIAHENSIFAVEESERGRREA